MGLILAIVLIGNGIHNESDRSLKENIVTQLEPLDIVNNLEGVYFNWKSGLGKDTVNRSYRIYCPRRKYVFT